MVDYYSQIFKRKSFHLFRDIGTITGKELAEIEQFIFTVTPLDNTIKFAIKIVPELETTCKRGAQYCILFYSETTGNYLQNIGYIGEQIDLYLVSKNIGTLWYGIGKPKEMQIGGLEFVIMMAVSKMPENKFRKDMFIDTCSTLGICAERNAIFNMITNGEQEIDKVLCILPDGSNGAPCGACRELMVQLMAGNYYDIEIMLDYSTGKTIKLGEITPEWWIK